MYSFLGSLAFVVWGLAPIYFYKLGVYDPLIILAHRIFWSATILLIARWLIPKLAVPVNKLTVRNILLSVLSGLMMNVSWLGFVYASVSDQLMAASLAFYISPILVFVIGFLFFKEKVSSNQILSFVLMVIAVAMYAFSEGHLPILSLFIASFFAMYLAIKKMISMSTFTSLLVEHVAFMPIALIYIVLHPQAMSFDTDLLLLAGTAPLQLLPVLMVTVALLKVPLSKMSLLQYIEPTLHFLLALWVFHTPVSNGQKYALLVIFISLLVLSFKKKSSVYANH